MPLALTLLILTAAKAARVLRARLALEILALFDGPNAAAAGGDHA